MGQTIDAFQHTIATRSSLALIAVDKHPVSAMASHRLQEAAVFASSCDYSTRFQGVYSVDSRNKAEGSRAME